MAGNSFGQIFKLTTFGESHGVAIGGVIDGFPSNFEIDLEAVQLQLNRRRPGQSAIVTQRQEDDKLEILSGVFEGKSTGAPIGFIIRNQNQKPKDYDHVKDNYRPSHADYTYDVKYSNRDYRGGGRSSARETACRVVAGALAQQVLKGIGVTISAYVSSVGPINLDIAYDKIDISLIDNNDVRCPNDEVAQKMEAFIKDIRKQGDTIGGTISCLITGMPGGIGEPVFNKLHAELGKAMLSINAVKGFEYGSGFGSTKMKGSDHNDKMTSSDGQTGTNFSGGIQGGISNGNHIYFNVAFKPVATIMQDQQSMNNTGEEVTIKGKGRHDPCVVPRAVPIVDAMAAIVILDHILLNQTLSVR